MQSRLCPSDPISISGSVNLYGYIWEDYGKTKYIPKLIRRIKVNGMLFL